MYAVVLVLHVWCSFVKHGLVTLVVIMMLNDTATFQVLFIVSLYCAWNITTVEINSGVHLRYLKVKSAKCLCLLPVVLVSLFWSCLKNLVLYTSLIVMRTIHVHT